MTLADARRGFGPAAWRGSTRFARLARLRGHRASGPLLLLGVGAGYLFLAQLVLWLNDPVNLGSGFWPAAGLSLGVLALTEPRRWGWVVAGVGIAELGGDLLHGYPVVAALWWTVGNCVEPLVGATLLRRWGNPSGSLVPVRQLLRFFGAAVVIAPLVGASLGSIGTVVGVGQLGMWQTWPKYVVGDALGVLVVAPMLLCWKERRIVRHRLETTTLALGLLVVTYMAFRTWGGVWDAGLPYLVIPLLTWAALRYGCRGAAVAVFTATQIANWSTASGDGTFAYAGAATGHAVTLLQMFLIVAAASTFVLAAVVEDLVDRTEVEARLGRQASTDLLTGLPNRALLTPSLLGAASQPQAGGVGVLACDLDHLKVVNDGLGHHAGDEVLVEVARRMHGCVRAGDLVARIGGDEFVIVVHGPEKELEELARRLITSVAQPMVLADGTRLTPSISVGIAHGDPGTDPASLLRDADAALYRAKDLGRGGWYRFDAELRVHVEDRLLIQTELRDALAKEDLYCVYQPEIVIASGSLFGFEALTRWQHPTRGLIPPSRFIPIIEDMGAANQLFTHVLDEVLGVQAEWAERLGFHPAVSVNVSAGQFDQNDLPAAVASALSRADAPSSSLWIEVTESTLAKKTASGGLLALHELGIRLAIDDFGTGWSSMARLAAFPWDLLKIDRRFVQALGGPNQHADQVVKSTIAMAQALGITTIAEGVETTEQLDRLTELGCDVVQGYLFAHPAPAIEAIEGVTPDGLWTGPGAHALRS